MEQILMTLSAPGPTLAAARAEEVPVPCPQDPMGEPVGRGAGLVREGREDADLPAREQAQGPRAQVGVCSRRASNSEHAPAKHLERRQGNA